MISLFNECSLEAMRKMKDDEFDLGIVDPPYGLGKGKTSEINPRSSGNSLTRFLAKDWDDEIPSDEYFSQLRRVCKNWIIWGANYFPISHYRAFVVWDKMTYIPTMSQVELAATSFDSPARYVKINSNDPDRIHPTQKPVSLYCFLLNEYAKKGDKILDTHLGSGSSAIAAYEMGFDFVGYELDKEYFDGAKKRLDNHRKQLKLFSEVS